MLAGVMAIIHLPIAVGISPASRHRPSAVFTATYLGASAETVQNTVTAVIEEQMSGLDHLLYIKSTSSSSGQSQVTLYFAPGTDPDIARSGRAKQIATHGDSQACRHPCNSRD